jgi:hypothetical protein
MLLRVSQHSHKPVYINPASAGFFIACRFFCLFNKQHVDNGNGVFIIDTKPSPTAVE